MKARFFLLVIAASIILSVSSCGGGNSGSGGPGSTSAGSALTVSVSPSVPPVSASKITTISSSGAEAAPGKTLPMQADGTIPFLVGSDESGNPYLLAIGSTTGVLDAESTVVAMVRVCLDLVQLPSGLTSDQLVQAIHSSSSYQALLSAADKDLAAGNSPLSDTTTVDAAWTVAQDASASIGNTSSGAVAAAQTTTVTLPLPFYLLNGIEPFNRIWLTDLAGNSVNTSNQTFITWQVDTKDPTGKGIDTKSLPPLQTTSAQLIGAYKGSASVTPVNGTSPNFTLVLSQSAKTRQINGITAFVKYMLFTYSSVAGLYPNPDTTRCITAVASSVFNDQFPNFVTQPDGTTAGAYIAKLLPISATGDVVYQKFSTCGLLPSVSQIFGNVIGSIWRRLQFARNLANTVGAVAQTFYYWNESDTFQVCKNNGSIVNCSPINIQIASCKAFADPITTTTISLTIAVTATGPVGSRLVLTNDFVGGPSCSRWTLNQNGECQRMVGQSDTNMLYENSTFGILFFTNPPYTIPSSIGAALYDSTGALVANATSPVMNSCPLPSPCDPTRMRC
ncbi:hypothetical protein AB4Y32_37670 [Paraburkholderia phymatum]|uniref:Uncharacterized protein n=1 Tax=Paraburkholderia phymatum TaxID=148447 RepID=A0ACC6UCE9_9BURK